MTATPGPSAERVAVLRRRSSRVLLIAAVPLAVAAAGVGLNAREWLFVLTGVAFAFFLGSALAGLVTMSTVLATLNRSMTMPGLGRRRARQAFRALRRNRPDLLDGEQLAAARDYAEHRLLMRDLVWPGMVTLGALPVMLLPPLLSPGDFSPVLVVIAVGSWVLAPLLLVSTAREGPALRRFLRATSAHGGDEGSPR